jgi:hypothetical protein
MAENTRIKINLNTGEIELEGSEDFVKNQISAIPDLLTKISGTLPKRISLHSHPQTETNLVEQAKHEEAPMPDNFGEWLNKFAKKLQQVDIVLATGYFKQKNSEDNAFETSEINKLLKEQGIKLSNAAVFLKLLQQSKFAIIIGKRGKLNRFRISPDGEAHIKELQE